jgi:hypothetical protein
VVAGGSSVVRQKAKISREKSRRQPGCRTEASEKPFRIANICLLESEEGNIQRFTAKKQEQSGTGMRSIRYNRCHLPSTPPVKRAQLAVFATPTTRIAILPIFPMLLFEILSQIALVPFRRNGIIPNYASYG